MAQVAIGLGSNMGDRRAHIESALTLLRDVVAELRVSSLIETAPMYVTDQPAYLNGAAIGFTDLGPLALLARLKAIELEVGRTPSVRYGPREIDLDLLAYGRVAFRSSGRLEVPHPRTPERRFVLEPLAELDPSMYLPGLGSVSALLAGCP
jgi:2-amino-4-hydroxy-6-hydroxymethyldihydropteridine diphosphokinase